MINHAASCTLTYYLMMVLYCHYYDCYYYY